MFERARGIAKKVFREARDLPVQVYIRIKKGLLVRFANNGIHQNGFQDLLTYTIRVMTKTGPVWVESNDDSLEGIREAFNRIAGAGAQRSSAMVARGTQKRFPKVKEHFPLQIKEVPQLAASAIEEGIELIRSAKASANGYYSAYERLFYLADSDGLELFHPATAVRFGVTVSKGAGKGYFSGYHPNPKRLRVAPLVHEALSLAEEGSRAEIVVPRGSYECIFSPRALLEFLEPLRRHFDLRLCKDQKSVLSGSLGKLIFSKTLNLSEEVTHAQQFGVPFDSEGNPKRRVRLVQSGILKELLAEGSCTRGLLEHPYYPENLIIEKGGLSLKEIFKQVRRGIFINKIWYHTLVRESRMEVTGLATAGSVYIEGGRIRGRAVHLRYHDSIFSVLGAVAAASREQILIKDGERGAALLPYLWVSRLRVV